jgi:hypothetical protein
MTWLVVMAAAGAFFIAAAAGDPPRRGFAGGAPIALASFLGVLWLAGLVLHASSWLTWWTLFFACAFLMLGLGGGTHRVAPPRFA